MVQFTPLTPPRGLGKDLPKEANADEQFKLRPESKVEPDAVAEYPYNKVTKHLDGSMMEFNTTPGTEYINLQTGDLKARITLFRKGGIEIRQEGPVFFHEMKSNVPTRPDTFGDKPNPVHETNVVKGLIKTSSNFREHSVDSTYKLNTDMAFYNARSIIDIKAKKITLEGSVNISGSLTVNGDVNINGDLYINGVNINSLFAQNDHEHE